MGRMKVNLFVDFTSLAIYLVDDGFTEHKIVPRYYIMIGLMAANVLYNMIGLAAIYNIYIAYIK